MGRLGRGAHGVTTSGAGAGSSGPRFVFFPAVSCATVFWYDGFREEEESFVARGKRQPKAETVERALQALRQAKASLEIENMRLPDGAEQLIADRLLGRMSERDFLRRALELAGRD